MTFQLKFWKRKRGRPRKKEPVTAWYPRISAVAFVFFLFAFLASDLSKLIQYSPFMFNFLFGVLILAVLILTWKKNRSAGFSFIILGVLYALATWNQLLAVLSISTALWLITTGLLFLLTDKNLQEKAAEVTAFAHDLKDIKK